MVAPIISRLKTRPDFLAAARGLTCARGAVSAQARWRGDDEPLVRIGFTATKRIGGAVVRNRAKRRLREAARLLAPLHVIPGCDYVFIARGGTPNRPWGSLLDDMTSALQRLAADLRAEPGPMSLAPSVLGDASPTAISGPTVAEPIPPDEALSAP